MVAKGPYKYCRYNNGVNVLFDIEKDPKEQINLIIDPQYQDIVRELDQIMIEEIFNSIIAANDDKVVNRGGISGEVLLVKEAGKELIRLKAVLISGYKPVCKTINWCFENVRNVDPLRPYI